MYSMSVMSAPPPNNLSDLAQTLSDMRDNCSKLSHDAHSSFSAANYQASLDSDLAQAKARNDVELYGMSHGHQEATRYMLDRLQEDAQNDVAKRKEIGDKLASDGEQVRSCVKDAEQQGKALYSTFKSHHKRLAAAAESLVTAWYTNLDEIDVDHPDGSDETHAAWKTAQTHAELSSS